MNNKGVKGNTSKIGGGYQPYGKGTRSQKTSANEYHRVREKPFFGRLSRIVAKNKDARIKSRLALLNLYR